MTHMLMGCRREGMRKAEQPVVCILSLKKCVALPSTRLLAHSALYPVLPLISDDGWSCPPLSSPSWALCLPWAVVLPSGTLPSLSPTCRQIERWLCHSQRKLFGALFLASLWIQHQYCLPNVGWEEFYHCLLRSKLGRWGLLSSSVTLFPTQLDLCPCRFLGLPDLYALVKPGAVSVVPFLWISLHLFILPGALFYIASELCTGRKWK